MKEKEKEKEEGPAAENTGMNGELVNEDSRFGLHTIGLLVFNLYTFP